MDKTNYPQCARIFWKRWIFYFFVIYIDKTHCEWDNGQLRHYNDYLLSGILLDFCPDTFVLIRFVFSSADAAFNNVWKPHNDRNLSIASMFAVFSIDGIRTGLALCYSSADGWLLDGLFHQYLLIYSIRTVLFCGPTTPSNISSARSGFNEKLQVSGEQGLFLF